MSKRKFVGSMRCLLVLLLVLSVFTLAPKAQILLGVPDVQVDGGGFGQKHEDEQGNVYLDAITGGDLGKVQELLANNPGLISIIDY